MADAVKESVIVEAAFRYKDEGAEAAKKIKREAEEAAEGVGKFKKGIESLNSGFEFLGKLGFAAMGLGAVADTLGAVANKGLEASLHAEELHDKMSATVWLLKSQGLVKGPKDFSDATKVAKGELEALRKMAAEGIGDPGRYIETYSKIANPLLKAGGTMKELHDFTRDLTPMAKEYGTAAVDSVLALLSGVKRIPPEMLGLLDLTKEQIRQWKTGGEALDALRHSMEAIRPIAEDQAGDMGSKIQKAHDAAAMAWREAGQVWAPVISGASEKLAKALVFLGSGKGQIEARDAMVKRSEELHALMAKGKSFNDAVAEMEWKDQATDFHTAALEATGKRLGGLGDEADGAAGALGDMRDAAVEFREFVEAATMARELAKANEAMGDGPMGVDEARLAAAALAEASGLPAAGMTDETTAALADLAKAAHDAGVEARGLPDLIAHPLTHDLAAAVLKGIELALLPAPLKALAESLKPGRAETKKPPQVHIGKVEIKVDARHQDPDRVAASIVNHLGRAALKPIASRAQLSNT